jgi:hypothetical protein
MRKHKKPKGLVKKEKRSKMVYIMSAVIVLVMVFSVVGYMSGRGPESEFAYNGHEIKYNGNKYIFDMDLGRLEFYSHPSQLEFIPYDDAITQALKDKSQIYLTFDPEMEFSLTFIDLLRLEMGKEYPILFNTQITDAILKETELYTLPKVTCEDTSDTIIQFIEGEPTQATIEGNCITLQSQNQGFLQLKDLITYNLLGVMENGQEY